jgi:hypothetical protein
LSLRANGLLAKVSNYVLFSKKHSISNLYNLKAPRTGSQGCLSYSLFSVQTKEITDYFHLTFYIGITAQSVPKTLIISPGESESDLRFATKKIPFFFETIKTH